MSRIVPVGVCNGRAQQLGTPASTVRLQKWAWLLGNKSGRALRVPSYRVRITNLEVPHKVLELHADRDVISLLRDNLQLANLLESLVQR